MSTAVEFEIIDAEESWAIFDAAAQRELGMAGTEFAKCWDEGAYADVDDVAVMRVVMLRPSGR